jgi:hypothetical protein
MKIDSITLIRKLTSLLKINQIFLVMKGKRKGKEKKGKNNGYSLCSIVQHVQILRSERSGCDEKLWSINSSKVTGYQIRLLPLNSYEEGITPIYKARKYFSGVNVTLNIVTEMPKVATFFYHLDNGFEFFSCNGYMHEWIISVFCFTR